MISIMVKWQLLFIACLVLSAGMKAQSIKVTDRVARKDAATQRCGYENQNEKSRTVWHQRAKRVSFGFLGIGGGNKNDLLLQGNEDEWIISPQYEEASKYFSENLAGVQLNGKVGFIDPRNRFIIPPRFESSKHLTGFNLGLAAVKQDGKYGFIDKTGRFVIPPTFEYAENFRDNQLATVKMDGKFGAINLKGEIVVPCKFLVEEAMIKVPFSNKPYRQAQEQAKADKNNGLFDELIEKVDSAAKAVNKLIRDSLYLPPCPYQPVDTTENGKNGISDADGNVIIPAQYDALIYTSGQLVLAGKEDKWGVYDFYGRCILPCQYDFITYDDDARVLLVQEDGRTGLYSPAGMMILPPCMDEIDDFAEGKAMAWMDYECGMINAQGVLTDSLLNRVFAKAVRLDESGDSGEALRLYRRILLAQPDFAMAHNNIGIREIEGEEYNEGICRLKVAHKLDPENADIAENLKQAKKDRSQRRWNRVGNAFEVAAAVIGVAAATYATVETVKQGGSSVSSSAGVSSYGSSATTSSGGGGNCAFYLNEISRYEQKLSSLNEDISMKSARATGKNAAHRISPENADGATGGDYRVINSSKATAREYQRRIEQLKRDARKKGCL